MDKEDGQSRNRNENESDTTRSRRHSKPRRGQHFTSSTMSSQSSSRTPSESSPKPTNEQLKVRKLGSSDLSSRRTHGSSTAQANLRAHNDSFDQLLRYIPAKYYIHSDAPPPAPSVRPVLRALVPRAAHQKLTLTIFLVRLHPTPPPYSTTRSPNRSRWNGAGSCRFRSPRRRRRLQRRLQTTRPSRPRKVPLSRPPSSLAFVLPLFRHLMTWFGLR